LGQLQFEYEPVARMEAIFAANLFDKLCFVAAKIKIRLEKEAQSEEHDGKDVVCQKLCRVLLKIGSILILRAHIHLIVKDLLVTWNGCKDQKEELDEEYKVNSLKVAHFGSGLNVFPNIVVIELDFEPLLLVPVANEEGDHTGHIEADHNPGVRVVVQVPVVVHAFLTPRHAFLEALIFQQIYGYIFLNAKCQQTCYGQESGDRVIIEPAFSDIFVLYLKLLHFAQRL